MHFVLCIIEEVNCVLFMLNPKLEGICGVTKKPVFERKLSFFFMYLSGVEERREHPSRVLNDRNSSLLGILCIYFYDRRRTERKYRSVQEDR